MIRKAIVTGANGFVGTALCKELAAQGTEVIAVVRERENNTVDLQNIQGIRIIKCNMENVARLPDLIEDSPDVLFHLAWAGVSGIARADYALQLTDVKWMLDAVGAAHALGCRRFVGTGTLAQMDVNAYSPLDGSTPNPVSCYGAAKIAAQYMSKAECNRLGLEHLWAFLSNIYGRGDHSSNFINFAIRAILSDEPANFTKGEQMYDFVHISDIAQGLCCIGEKGKQNHSYFIGSGAPQKLKHYLELIHEIANPQKELNLGAVPFHGVALSESIFFDRKLFDDTGYTPRIAFREGIQDTVQWIKETENA